MSESYPKKEKLKSQKLIESLFQKGQSVSVYPLRLVYIKDPVTSDSSIKVGVSVSKRNFKKAVDRNRIKRVLREAYRLNKASYFNNNTTPLAFMILYIGKDGIEFDSIDTTMKQLLKKFTDKISED
ncbi:ribonuclease P protein component [Flavobacteriales bacterium 33_180_T64]|nr:ribonuclease P protein component [Flavobacteriales bacterium 33_180_T64]